MSPEPDPDARFLKTFPGPPMVRDHFTQAIGASGLTFFLTGECSPQEVLDEWLRLVPLFERSGLHDETGIGFALGDDYLAWAVLTDGRRSMVLYPGVNPGPESPAARQVFDAAFAELRHCGAGFRHAVLFSGEGYISDVEWIENASLVPLHSLRQWRVA